MEQYFENQVEHKIADLLRVELKKRLLNSVINNEVKVFEGELPINNIKNIFDQVTPSIKKANYPYVLVRAWESEEGLNYAFTNVELICGIYDSQGFKSLQYLMEEVRLILMSTEAQVEAGFLLKRDSPIKVKVLKEEKQGDFCYGKLAFQVYLAYNEQPNLL